MIFRQFDKFAAGSTVRNLNIDLVGRVRVCLPPLAEQRAIGEKLDRLGERTAEFEGQYRRKLAALAELKKSLLARAFSGELTARDALAA